MHKKIAIKSEPMYMYLFLFFKVFLCEIISSGCGLWEL